MTRGGSDKAGSRGAAGTWMLLDVLEQRRTDNCRSDKGIAGVGEDSGSFLLGLSAAAMSL